MNRTTPDQTKPTTELTRLSSQAADACRPEAQRSTSMFALPSRSSSSPTDTVSISPRGEQSSPRVTEAKHGADASSKVAALNNVVVLLLSAAPWHDPATPRAAFELLRATPRLSPSAALALLRLTDETVRAYAVRCLTPLDDTALGDLLGVLVQALKHERCHYSPLAHLY